MQAIGCNKTKPSKELNQVNLGLSRPVISDWSNMVTHKSAWFDDLSEFTSSTQGNCFMLR